MISGTTVQKWNRDIHGYKFDDLKFYLNPILRVKLNVSIYCSLVRIKNNKNQLTYFTPEYNL